jgi:hypothetical protein
MSDVYICCSTAVRGMAMIFHKVMTASTGKALCLEFAAWLYVIPIAAVFT